MFKLLRGFFSSDLSIDPGTADTIIHMRNQDIVLNEPSGRHSRVPGPNFGRGGGLALEEMDARHLELLATE